MFTSLFTNPLSFVFWLIALVVGITIHEYAHAVTADRLGDPTPRLQGRLTLNPMAHLDLFGTLMLLIARFGWGKPVQFDPFNLQHPRRDAAIISLAGPATNITAAILASLLLRLAFAMLPPASTPAIVSVLAYQLLPVVIIMNVILAVFNLIPVHPLDGFKIVGGILPKEYVRQWNSLERYGMLILLFLVFPILGNTAPIQEIISPIIDFLVGLLIPTTGRAGII